MNLTRYSPCAPFLQAIGPLPLDCLLRGIRNRVFSRPAPAPTGKRGAPRKDGERFACHEESTHGEPDAQWEGCDEQGQHLRVERSYHLHVKQARELDLSVYRLTRLDATQTARRPPVSWFIWLGLAALPLAEVWSTYQCRYGIEHGYRFEKQQLLWDQRRLRTPEQFERWTRDSWRPHTISWGWPVPWSKPSVSRWPALGTSGHSPTGTPGSGKISCHLGHTGSPAPTTRKIAGTGKRREGRGR